jgi:hypothetical protein
VKAAIRVRVPDWAEHILIAVNGKPANTQAKASNWAAIEREWNDGDRIDIRIPMALRAEAVDTEHPDRFAVLYGPLVLVEDMRFNLGMQMQPGHHSPQDLRERLRPADEPLHFRVVDPPRQVVHSGVFYPYWQAKQDVPYRMYHDFSRS